MVRRRKSGCGNEVGVENGDELASRGLQAVFQRAGLVAFAIGAMDVDDGHALRGEAVHAIAGDLLRFIGGIVEHLHVEKLARIVEARNGFDEPLDHIALVENGELNRDARPVVASGGGPGTFFAYL